MSIDVLILWLFIWVVLLVMSTIEHRGPVFGVLAAVWIIYIGIYLFMSGLQFQSGMSIVTTGVFQNISNVYSDVPIPIPFNSYNLVWAVPFWALGIYIGFMSVTKKKEG